MNHKSNYKLRLIAFLVAVVSVALAQPNIVVSPQSIVVNPLPSYDVEVFVDKDSSGEESPSYDIGENIQISVRSSQDAYVYLFNVRSDGTVDQILPNNLDEDGQNNFVSAGQTKRFPPENAGYNFTVDGPEGLDKVIAVASAEQLDTSQLANFESDPNFASSNIGEEGFADTLSIIVTPIAQDNWVTDTALFYVGSAPAQPRYGTFDITSNPSGAEAYVDGQFVGVTPTRYGTTLGQHSVELRLEGYDVFNTTVQLSGGGLQPVSADLTSAAQPTPQPAPQPDPITVNPSPNTEVISSRFGLTLYPGAVLGRLEQDDDELDAEFTSSASFANVFDDLETQLIVGGWQRESVDYRDNASKADATYTRGNERLELELDKRGNSDRFKLELDF